MNEHHASLTRTKPADDANGNTLSDGSGRQYSWDFENRLTSTVSGTGTTTFEYDPFGRRIQKSGPLGTTAYLYDSAKLSANIVETLDSAGSILARYTQGIVTDQPIAQIQSGNTNYYEQDAIGSISSLSSPSGGLVNTYVYDAFGNLRASTGTVLNPFRYAARDFDLETGIYYNRLRFLDTNAGRFISEDPIGYLGGMNFYAYTRNNPLIFTDPLGRGPWDWLTALGIVGWFQCRYYMGQCASTGLACKQECSSGDWQDTLNRLAAQNTPYESTANIKQCMLKKPACQKMIQTCGGVPMGFTGFPPLR